jgi:hypothetical protein
LVMATSLSVTGEAGTTKKDALRRYITPEDPNRRGP